jgi:hypothetical protein
MQIERIYHPDMPSQMRAILLLLHIRLPGEHIVRAPEKETGQDCTSTHSTPSMQEPCIAQHPSSHQAADIHS